MRFGNTAFTIVGMDRGADIVGLLTEREHRGFEPYRPPYSDQDAEREREQLIRQLFPGCLNCGQHIGPGEQVHRVAGQNRHVHAPAGICNPGSATVRVA